MFGEGELFISYLEILKVKIIAVGGSFQNVINKRLFLQFSTLDLTEIAMVDMVATAAVATAAVAMAAVATEATVATD